jgi:hypothetical protein
VQGVLAGLRHAAAETHRDREHNGNCNRPCRPDDKDAFIDLARAVAQRVLPMILRGARERRGWDERGAGADEGSAGNGLYSAGDASSAAVAAARCYAHPYSGHALQRRK